MLKSQLFFIGLLVVDFTHSEEVNLDNVEVNIGQLKVNGPDGYTISKNSNGVLGKALGSISNKKWSSNWSGKESEATWSSVWKPGKTRRWSSNWPTRSKESSNEGNVEREDQDLADENENNIIPIISGGMVGKTLVEFESSKETDANKNSESFEFDERMYPDTQMACTFDIPDDGSNMEEIEGRMMGMFKNDFNYIQGENAEKRTMEMTRPVFSFLHHDKDKKVDKMAMCFWMNQDTSEALPAPSENGNVKLWTMKKGNFYVRRFSLPEGMGHPEIYGQEMDMLKKGLEAEGLSNSYVQSMCVTTNYDAPWVKINRRDEVMLKKIEDGNDEWLGPFEKM